MHDYLFKEIFILEKRGVTCHVAVNNHVSMLDWEN